MNDPILITGMPRSGNSIIASTINYCGVFGGIMTKQNQSYEESEFSNNQIRARIVKSYFERNGWDVRGQYPLPKTEKVIIPFDWRKRVESIMVSEGYKDGKWMYKDAKSSLVWPVWNNAFPDAKWIIVRRRTGDVVQSCLKTGYMSFYEDAEGWLEWVHEYEKKFVEMIEAGLNVKIVWPERMVDGDYKQLMELIDWLGLEWKEEVINHITPMLWGGKKEVLNGKS